MAGIRASTRWLGESVCASRASGCKVVPPKVEDVIRSHLRAGNGILKVARIVGCGSGTVQRVKWEMAIEVARA